MRARVIAILVARNGGSFLGRTLAAIESQSRRPDSLVFVDAGSSDATDLLLAAGGPTQFIDAKSRTTFGGGIAEAMRQLPPVESDDEWLWLLAHDNAPEPDALAALLNAVEIAPSVAVAGPKLMQWALPDVIETFGESMTPYGSSVQLVSSELDQAQYDRRSDLLAVAAGGMLVRRTVWASLGGFDPGLPSADAALDFCVRVRLAGHRVVTVPEARVASAGGPELFGRDAVGKAGLARVRRAAQLHRRLVYSPALGVPLHWLLLLPLAILRSIGHLFTKRAWAIPGEFGAAIATAFDGRILGARRNLARGRTLGWGAVAPLRVQPSQARELAANRAAAAASLAEQRDPATPRPSFLGAGGVWVILVLAIVGVLVNLRLLGASALSGGGLVPLSTSVPGLWEHVGYGWHDIGAGFEGAADPFAFVLAVFGSLTFWAPSASIVLIYICALPLAGLAAWAAAARLSKRGWAPAVAAILWALAPPFLASLNAGHLGAVIAHLLLPWLVLATVNAAKSWSAAGAAALLFAGVTASAPALIPALLLAWLVWLVAHPRSVLRLIGIPIPAIVLFAPLALQQAVSGDWIAFFAEPGLVVSEVTASGWQLSLGSPTNDLNGWATLLAGFGLPPIVGAFVVAVLLAPFAGLAVLALFVPGSRRSIPSMVIALLGFVTAVVGTYLALSHVGEATAVIWPGAALSLYWLGLVGAVVVALEALGSAVALPGLLASIGVSLLAFPLLAAPIAATSAVHESSGRLLPAFVTAAAGTNPSVGTLDLTAHDDGSFAAELHRGVGTTLDEQSTFAATTTEVRAAQTELAELAGNLASRSGFDAVAELQAQQIGFVVLADAEPGPAAAARLAAADALDSNPALVAIGATANGYLWRFDAFEADADAVPSAESDTLRAVVLSVDGIVLGIALLLAIPTGTRRRPVSEGTDENPADTFEEDESA